MKEDDVENDRDVAERFLREKGLAFVPEPAPEAERRLPAGSFTKTPNGDFIFSVDGAVHGAFRLGHGDVDLALRAAWERVHFEMERKKRSPHE